MSHIRLVPNTGYAEALHAVYLERVRFYTRAIQDADRRLNTMDRPSMEWSQLNLAKNIDAVVLTALTEMGKDAVERLERRGVPETPLDTP